MRTDKAPEDLLPKLKAYKRKYYQNLLVKGLLISLTIITSVYLFVNSAEYTLRFNSSVRTIMFFSFIALCVFLLFRWVLIPLAKIMMPKSQLSNEEAARQIGKYFPEVNDKLLNTLQLMNQQGIDDALLRASIAQKSKEFNAVPFSEAVEFKQNQKYLKYFAIPAAIVLILLVVKADFFTESTSRIMQFNKEFIPEAPFQFVLQNEELQAFKNEDYTLQVKLEGSAIPEQVYLNTTSRQIKMRATGNGTFEYTFPKIQRAVSFSFDAAGYHSDSHILKVYNRPGLKNFNVQLSYPEYLNKQNETLKNRGQLEIPEGTNVQWTFLTLDTDSLEVFFPKSKESFRSDRIDTETFSFSKKAEESQDYMVRLSNQHSHNKDQIAYHIEVIPDRHPKINLKQFQDTTLFSYVILGGNISDDYGLTSLKLFYKRKDQKKYANIPISILRNQNTQQYYYQWRVDSLGLERGEEVEYFLRVTDNDGVNGWKWTNTPTYTFKIPTKKEIRESIEKSSARTENQAEKTIRQAKSLQEKLKENIDRMKSKKEMSWQEKQKLEELIHEKKKLEEEIQKLQEQFKEENLKRERFTEQDEQLKEKAEQLEKLMDEMLDEETKKLYEELQKLLEEQGQMDQVQDKLNQIEHKEQSLEKELERALELFKRMKVENELNQLGKELEDMAKKQEELAKESGEEKKSEQELAKEQEKLNEEFKELQEEMKKMQELNQELKNPEPLQDTKQEEQSIEQEQQKSKEDLQQNKRNDAQKSQQKAAEQMKQMAQKMQQMQSSMQMQAMQENLDHLREILDNLIKLSFDQEQLMKDFREVRQSDPRFIELSQKQLKLKDDAKIIEDSLTSLANRVFQIQSFVTREVGEMNRNMEGSVESLRERRKSQAVSKQQFAMTSMNNLALLLDDVLDQMQQQMASAMSSGKGEKKKQQTPSMSEMQKQLNEQIQQLQKSGKKGRQLSEELAKMAAEQERIRRALKEMEKKLNQGKGEKGGDKLNKLMKEMEETEKDLVNKRITQQTIERQKEILTRLLEAEDAMREKEQDEKREAQQAKQKDRRIPDAFEEYIKLKEQEIELYKTVPPKLKPYYKKEVNEYFKRIED
jgi:hypothetical protein